MTSTIDDIETAAEALRELLEAAQALTEKIGGIRMQIEALVDEVEDLR